MIRLDKYNNLLLHQTQFPSVAFLTEVNTDLKSEYKLASIHFIKTQSNNSHIE